MSARGFAHGRRQQRGFALALGAASGLVSLVSARGAQAQTASELATRTELASQAAAARAQQRHADALDLATRAERIRSSPSVLRFIADEYRALGRLAESYETLLRCARSTDRDTSEAQRQRAVGECSAAATALRPRLAALTVRIEGAAPAGVTVRVENRPLSDVQLGAPVLVSPGSVAVNATAPTREPFQESVTVAAGEQRTVRITLAPARAAEPVASIVRPPDPPPREVHRGPGPWRALSLAAVGLGGAALITSGVLVGLREGQVAAYNADYQSGVCAGYDVQTDDAACRGRIAQGETFGAAAIGLAAGGAALTVGGVVGFVLTRPAPERATARAPSVRCAPGWAGAHCAGVF